MRDSLVGSGVRRPCFGAFPYFARKPSPTGDHGVRSVECDRVRWVTVVTTLRAEDLHSSSPPSSPSPWPACHSITSGTLGSEAISSTSSWETYLLFPPQVSDISKR